MISVIPQTIFREYNKNEKQHSDRSVHDRQRHRKLVRDKIKDNLPDILSDESIIGQSGDKIIKVPIRSIKEYRFSYGDNKGVSQGDGTSQPGDVVGKGEPQNGQGKGDKAGSEKGVDYYETDITLDELTEILFEDLRLPNLNKKNQKIIDSFSRRKKDGFRRMGIQVRLDKFKTARERVRRKKATERHADLTEVCDVCNGLEMDWACEECGGNGIVDSRFRFRKEDRRFKHFDVKPKPESNAVIFYILDVSGSMDTVKKYLARSFFYALYLFIKSKYQRLEVVFISHHTEAHEVDEKQFFSKGESGGTFISSGLQLALDIIENRYNSSIWNIYAFYCGDGDNFDTDNPKALAAMTKLSELSNLTGYIEIKPTNTYYSDSQLDNFRKIDCKQLKCNKIERKEDVWPVFKDLLSIENVV